MNSSSPRIGKYTMNRRLGKGGIAEVWQAYDTQLQRYVAVKVLYADLRLNADSMQRFQREAHVLASLRHPNIVQIHDFKVFHPPQSQESFAYMVMDYVEGETLADYLYRTSYQGIYPTPAELVHLLTSICSAIDYAHSKGVIHRDIKPANILLDRHNTLRNPMGEPILTDFGIVKLFGGATASLTGTGFGMGTPLYISPEQALGLTLTERSDLYSLGIIIYELCTGRYPFQGEHAEAIMLQQIHKQPEAPSKIRPDLPPALSQVILCCLAKNPADRFPSATAIALAVAQSLDVSFPVNPGSSPRASTPPGEHAQMHPPGLRPAFTLPTKRSPTATTPDSSSNRLTSPTTSGSGRHSGSSPPLPLKTGDRTPTPTPVTPAPVQRGLPGRRLARPRLLITAAILLVTLLLVGSAILLHASGLLFPGATRPPSGSPSSTIVGYVHFTSSGQLNQNSNQGTDDGISVRLQGVPAPAQGQSYYAWLLSDTSQSDVQAIPLGKGIVQRGTVQITYPGDPQHTNLLAIASRFLITTESASSIPSNPSPDPRSWVYYATIAQTPNPHDSVHHYSLLDHLRHLLVADPNLQALSLQGGLDAWLFRNMSAVFQLSNTANQDMQSADAARVRSDVISILDYLDGSAFVGQDVPTGTPLLVDPQAAKVALLEFDPAAQTPPGYLYHVGVHLTGVVQSPGVTPGQQSLAGQLDLALNSANRALEQARHDAVQLLQTGEGQLAQAPALALLHDLTTQIKIAFLGTGNPSGGAGQQGIQSLHQRIQMLAVMVVRPYTGTM